MEINISNRPNYDALSNAATQTGTATVSYQDLFQNKMNEIVDKIKNGETEPSIQIGGQAFTDKEWERLIHKVDRSIEVAKEEQKAPYQALAKDGLIDYKGTVFVCDYKKNRLCLGDVSNPKNCLNIPLSEGGSLVVNTDNLGDLSKAIGMFSPEDVNRILNAMAKYKKIQEMQQEIEDDTSRIGSGNIQEGE